MEREREGGNRIVPPVLRCTRWVHMKGEKNRGKIKLEERLPACFTRHFALFQPKHRLQGASEDFAAASPAYVMAFSTWILDGFEPSRWEPICLAR